MPDLFVAPKKNESLNIVNKMPLGMFTSFCENPDGITFNTQEKDEQISLLLRRHFVTNIPWIFITIILIVFPFFLPFLTPFLKSIFPFALSCRTQRAAYSRPNCGRSQSLRRQQDDPHPLHALTQGQTLSRESRRQLSRTSNTLHEC